MTKPDPTLAQIAAQFTRHSVEKSGGAYLILDRPTANAIARLRPIPGTDRFELFYWSNLKGRWTTFGNLGRMRLMLENAHEIVEKDPMFPHLARSVNRQIFGQSRAKVLWRIVFPPAPAYLVTRGPARLHLPPVRPHVSADDPSIPHLESVASEASWSRYRSFLFAASGPAPKVVRIDARRLENGYAQIPLDQLL